MLLADDQVFLHSLLTRLLAPTCDVIGVLSDSTELVEATQRLRPDVVVVDLNMPKLSGFDACRLIRAAAPSVQVIILTADEEPRLRERALAVGAAAFVRKLRAGEELAAAVHDALRG